MIRPLHFWERAKVLQQYLEVVLDSLDCVSVGATRPLCDQTKTFI